MPGLSEAEIEALFEPFERYEKLGLAVSGGPDSLALMLLAAKWARREGRPRLIVYTVDHALRLEAAGEAAMVLREAAALGLETRSLRWEGDKPTTGVQAAARSARYRLLAAAMAADGVSVIATAHHLADQAETVLMRLAHGSGIEGLRGMDRLSRVEGCDICRPLLGVRPEVLREVVSDAGLAPAMDPGNTDADYERVRWRLMLPVLEALGLNLERLGTLARRMDEASAVIRGAAEAAYAIVEASEGQAAMARSAFAALPPPVATVLLGRVLGEVDGDLKPPPLGALELLARRAQRAEPLKPVTLHGCVISSDGASITVRKEKPRTAQRKATRAVTAN